MSRPFKGTDLLEEVSEKLKMTNDVKELRILQSVVLPLQGLDLDQTSAMVGRSRVWTSNARNNYIKSREIPVNMKKGLRNKAYMSFEEEGEFLMPYLGKAREGVLLEVSQVHRALENRLGKRISLSTTYNMLHRHKWRKLSPDKRHILSDERKQLEWKKNSE